MSADQPTVATGAEDAPITESTGDPDESLLRDALGMTIRRPPVSLMPGQVIDEAYRIERQIGAGGMGVVYLARDLRLHRDVAIKLHAAVAGEPGGERLMREAAAMAQLSHGNVATVHEVGTWAGHPYVAMEYVAGGTARTWLTDQPRTPREILALFLAAGRGLAAAHAAGLVHRDFKPDNVLVGDDGRIRVADFGLARGFDDETASQLDRVPTTALPPSSVTRTGAIVGTPAYMAPEQRVPGKVGPAADQFAFAVALWEALGGERPFAGNTDAQLVAAIAGGQLRTPHRRMPVHVHRALTRALAADPAARFPSMDALIAELARDPAARRRRIALAAAGVAILGGAVASGILLGAPTPAVEPCQGADAEIAQVWTPERAAAITAAFPANAEGAAAAALVRDRIDRYAAGWALGHRAACRATRVDGAQSDDLLDRRMACLDRARSRLDAVIGWIGSSAGVERASAAIDDLPSVDRCADPTALSALAAQPADPQLRARIADITAETDRILVAVHDPEGADLIARSQAALDAAHATGWAPLVALAGWVRAEVLANVTGRKADAIAAKEVALRWAVEGGDDELAARSMSDLAWLLAVEGQHQRATSWVTLARATARRAGHPPQTMLRLTTDAAEVARYAGRFDEAIAEAEAALALVAGRADPSESGLGRGLSNLALCLSTAGHHLQAIAIYERAIAVDSAALGAGHPSIAHKLDNQASAMLAVSRFEPARAALERAVAIEEAWYGPDDWHLADTLQTLANLHHRTGNLAKARVLLTRAVEIVAATAGTDSTDYAYYLGNLAVLDADDGNFEAAVEGGTRALTALEATSGRDDPFLIGPLVLLGYSERHLGRHDESVAHLARAVAIAEQALGPDHPVAANPRVELGHTEIARGRIDAGIALYERVIATSAKDPNSELRITAEARLALADVTWPRDRRRALAHAEAARDDYKALGPGFEPQLGNAEAWLAKHR